MQNDVSTNLNSAAVSDIRAVPLRPLRYPSSSPSYLIQKRRSSLWQFSFGPSTSPWPLLTSPVHPSSLPPIKKEQNQKEK